MKKILLFLSMVFISAGYSSAAQWQIMGTRPMGMGGAFVGVAEGPVAQYWNPAGLVPHDDDNYSGFQLPVGVKAEVTGELAKNASKISEMADKFKRINDLQKNGGAVDADDIAAFVKTLSLLKDIANDGDKGLVADVNAGLDFKFSKVSVSINNFTTVGFIPDIDTKNIALDNSDGLSGVTVTNEGSTPAGLGSQYDMIISAINALGFDNLKTLLGNPPGLTASGLANFLLKTARDNNLSDSQITEAANILAGYAPHVKSVVEAAAGGGDAHSYKNNESRLEAKAASMMEVAVGYAWDIEKVPGLSVGGNLKMINGYTAAYTYDFMKDGKPDDFDYDRDVKSTWQPAADIGVLWNITKYVPSLSMPVKAGIVARNINSPEFKYVTGNKYKYDRQVRAGASVTPVSWITVAADIDVTENKTLVDNFKSRQLALGAEFNLGHSLTFNFPLRAGIMKNIAESDSDMAYTAGFGLHFVHMAFDFAGMISSSTTEIDKKEYPTHGGASFTFSLLF